MNLRHIYIHNNINLIIPDRRVSDQIIRERLPNNGDSCLILYDGLDCSSFNSTCDLMENSDNNLKAANSFLVNNHNTKILPNDKIVDSKISGLSKLLVDQVSNSKDIYVTKYIDLRSTANMVEGCNPFKLPHSLDKQEHLESKSIIIQTPKNKVTKRLAYI